MDMLIEHLHKVSNIIWINIQNINFIFDICGCKNCGNIDNIQI